VAEDFKIVPFVAQIQVETAEDPISDTVKFPCLYTFK